MEGCIEWTFGADGGALACLRGIMARRWRRAAREFLPTAWITAPGGTVSRCGRERVRGACHGPRRYCANALWGLSCSVFSLKASSSPLLAAYLITLVVGLAFAVLHWDHRGEAPHAGREKFPVVAGKITLRRRQRPGQDLPQAFPLGRQCALRSGAPLNQLREKALSHQGRRPHDPPDPRRHDTRPAGRRHPGSPRRVLHAQDKRPQDKQPAELEAPTVEVIGKTPLPGLGVPINEVPSNVKAIGSKEIQQTQSLNLPDLLQQALPSVNLNQIQGNPYQPNLTYRGFTASPLLGEPQGLSVFQDGVRINQPFGDVVSWDLIPAVRDLDGQPDPRLGPAVRAEHAGRRAVDAHQERPVLSRTPRWRPTPALGAAGR